MKRTTYDTRKQKLSKRATKTLTLIEKGRYYPDEFNQNKPVIVELMKAGLIRPTMRVVVVARHFVPTSGYIGYKPEKYTS